MNFAPMLMKRLTLAWRRRCAARTNAEKGAIRDALLREVWPLIEEGQIKPVVDRVFPLSEAQTPMPGWRKTTISARFC